MASQKKCSLILATVESKPVTHILRFPRACQEIIWGRFIVLLNCIFSCVVFLHEITQSSSLEPVLIIKLWPITGPTVWFIMADYICHIGVWMLKRLSFLVELTCEMNSMSKIQIWVSQLEVWLNQSIKVNFNVFPEPECFKSHDSFWRCQNSVPQPTSSR